MRPGRGILVLALACGACFAPKLEGHKLRSDDQEAMPYYLPKPYLLVTKNFDVALETGKTVYAQEIVYLPDRCNQYGLRISRGIGTLDSTIELEDGWKFTGTHLKTDSKTPETLEAIAEPIGEIGTALLRRQPRDQTGAGAPAAADIALYDLFTGDCVFAWPGRDSCAMPTACPARE